MVPAGGWAGVVVWAKAGAANSNQVPTPTAATRQKSGVRVGFMVFSLLKLKISEQRELGTSAKTRFADKHRSNITKGTMQHKVPIYLNLRIVLSDDNED
jgi:hypothetical protein